MRGSRKKMARALRAQRIGDVRPYHMTAISLPHRLTVDGQPTQPRSSENAPRLRVQVLSRCTSTKNGPHISRRCEAHGCAPTEPDVSDAHGASRDARGDPCAGSPGHAWRAGPRCRIPRSHVPTTGILRSKARNVRRLRRASATRRVPRPPPAPSCGTPNVGYRAVEGRATSASRRPVPRHISQAILNACPGVPCHYLLVRFPHISESRAAKWWFRGTAPKSSKAIEKE